MDRRCVSTGPSQRSSQARAFEDPGGQLVWQRAYSSGLVGVWARENTRETLFNAMERREAYGSDFNPEQRAFYQVRVIEIPAPR